MVDEDAPKKSVTDGMVKCLSLIGVAGDIFSGRWDDSKYVAEQGARERNEKPSAQKPQTVPSNLTISDEQFKTLNDLLDTAGVDKQKFCESYGIPSVAALPDEKFQNAVHRLNATIKKIGEKK